MKKVYITPKVKSVHMVEHLLDSVSTPIGGTTDGFSAKRSGLYGFGYEEDEY